jgi:hypothetical protein
VLRFENLELTEIGSYVIPYRENVIVIPVTFSQIHCILLFVSLGVALMWLERTFEFAGAVSAGQSTLPTLVSIQTNFIEFRNATEGSLSDPLLVFDLKDVQSVNKLASPAVGFTVYLNQPKGILLVLEDKRLQDLEYAAWARALIRFSPMVSVNDMKFVNPSNLIFCARQCLKEIFKRGGNKVEGVFRLTGDIGLVDILFKEIVLHEGNQSDEDCWRIIENHAILTGDVHNLSSMFRRIIRELPESLLGDKALVDQFLKVKHSSSLEDIKKLICNLSPSSFLVLSELIWACKEVTVNTEQTLMNPSKIGRCIGPNINFYSTTADISTFKDFSVLFELLTENYDVLFSVIILLLILFPS